MRPDRSIGGNERDVGAPSKTDHAERRDDATWSRRDALGLCVAIAAAGVGLQSCAVARTQAESDGGDALDQALRLLHGPDPERSQGFSTHAPMVAETLCVLGYADRAATWVARDGAPVRRIAPPSTRIDAANWRTRLGPRWDAPTWEAQLESWSSWRVYFEEELARAPWARVLDTWTARLAPGWCSAATHGVIRTSHAARGLSRRETPERKSELARGLAYWAASYQELPARAHGRRVPTYAAALAELPLYWSEHRRAPAGNIVSGFRAASEIDGLRDARDLVAAQGDVSTAISELTSTFANVYLRHGTRHDALAFVHGVTGVGALRRMLPHIEPQTARAALPYAWQASACIYSAYARPDDTPVPSEVTLSPAELVVRAVENGDAHAVKLTETLLSEHALSPNPVYLAAAQDAVSRLV